MDRLLDGGPGLDGLLSERFACAFFRRGLGRIAAGENTGNGANHANVGG
jgi:hypothetical protein